MTLAANSKASPDTPEARRYNRLRRWLSVADALLGLGYLLLLLFARSRGGIRWSEVLRDWSYRAARQHYALGLFFFIVLLLAAGKLLTLGLDYYGFRLEHRYHLSNQRLRGWVWDEFKGWLVGLVLGSIVAEVVYWTIRTDAERWWLIAWAIFIFFTVIFAQLAPVVLFPLFYKFRPLENEELRQRLLRLSERAGAHVRGIYEWKLSEKSNKANAALAGLGSTRRILLADTLLQNYTPDEIEAILAHELGHHVHQHVLKGIVVHVGVTLVGFWATAQVLLYSVDQWQMFPALADFANLPLLLLVSTVVSLLLMPALNAYSRFHERQADRYCFASIPQVTPFVTSMQKLAEQNLAERQPAGWIEWLFHSHPAISKRIAAAEKFARSQQQA